jgi:two-component system phosphate regulon response regulator PhoB
MKNQPRILIVEDEPAIAELIVINLQHGGFVAVVAQDSVTAQRELDAVLPDAILLDWMLPGQSGLTLARQWRKNERTKGIPILMLTARGWRGRLHYQAVFNAGVAGSHPGRTAPARARAG